MSMYGLTYSLYHHRGGFLVGAVKVGGVLGCYPYSESRNFLLCRHVDTSSDLEFKILSFSAIVM